MTRDKGRDVSSEHLWRCSCGGMHFISISRHYWQSEDEYCSYFSVDSADRYNGTPWKERLAVIWHVLRGDFHHWAEVTLDPHIAREISADLLLAADEQEAANAPRQETT